MINLNKFSNEKKLYIFIFLVCSIGIILLFLLLNIKIDNALNALLEVDSNKDLKIKLSTSNINLNDIEKNIFISVNSKQFLLSEVKFIYLGNNSYTIEFYNDELYKILKTNSLYEIKIISSTKKVFEILFNI